MSYAKEKELIPIFIDQDDAMQFYSAKKHDLTDAERAYTVHFLSMQGLSNKEIREALGIDKVYEVTHLKRCGAISEEELILWHRNPNKITFGHVRAVSKLPRNQREKLLRDLLVKKVTVHKYELIAQGQTPERDKDIDRYARIAGDTLGRDVQIRFNPQTAIGSITLAFHTLDDLDRVLAKLGFKYSEEGF